MSMLPDLVTAVLILGMTYALMSEGLWGAALMCMNTLFAGLIAFNFYEPLAALLSQNVDAMSGYADTLCLMVLFIVSLLLLRLTTESLAPAMVRFPMPVYHIGRVLFAFVGSCIAISIVWLAFHTSPVQKKMFGVVDYARKPPFGQGLDHKWLAFFQYTTGQTFAKYLGADYRIDQTSFYKDSKLFDPAGRWLIDHQNARPYGTDTVPAPDTSADAAAAAAPAGGGGPPGMPGAPPGMPGAPPGMPGAR
jgi:hypothetical protein